MTRKNSYIDLVEVVVFVVFILNFMLSTFVAFSHKNFTSLIWMTSQTAFSIGFLFNLLTLQNENDK